jgi:hypothetical protein
VTTCTGPRPSHADDCLYSYNYDDIILVVVGPKKTTFIVRHKAICANSKFFQTNLNDRAKAGHDKTVHLPDVDSETFERYVDWTHDNVFVAGEAAEKAVVVLVKMYLLGLTLDDVKLRNMAIKALIHHMTVDLQHPGPATVRLIWENTASGSSLRNLIVDSIVRRIDRDYFEEKLKSWPSDLLRELTMKFLRQESKAATEDFSAKSYKYLEAEGKANIARTDA